MSVTLWINTEKEETIELATTMSCYAAFAEMARIAGDEWITEYEALAGVLSACEDQEDVPPDWLKDMRSQAHRFLANHGDDLTQALGSC